MGMTERLNTYAGKEILGGAVDQRRDLSNDLLYSLFFNSFDQVDIWGLGLQDQATKDGGLA
jgi:hypothetical protein